MQKVRGMQAEREWMEGEERGCWWKLLWRWRGLGHQCAL